MTGFKSFADKMDIKLDNKITCIVGPNGSGKSNVVDAVRWVLGEQSVKSLRGDGSMSDVIFSGSKSRNPLNVASVELVFDNTDHFLNIPYTELSIKRKVYRSGENEYYLNGDKCRLKDVLNLLLDSGMGKESFNIISQGQVEKILSNSPYDRRIIFEEASGILKYKKRKEEALRKLDRTHNNIDRVNDIISELEVQVGPLKEQSEKALEYLENKSGLDKYEVSLLTYDIENISNELEIAKEKKEKLDQQIMEISNDSSKNDVIELENSNKLEKLEKERLELNKKLLSITEEVEKINGEKNLLKERSKVNKEENELKEEIRKTLEVKSELEGKITVIEEEIKVIIDKSRGVSLESNEIKSQIERLKTNRIMLSNDYSRLDREIVNINHKIDSLNQEIEMGGNIPNSVRAVLNEGSLTGIHNTIGNILNIDSKYTKALDVAISSNKNFVITDSFESSKKAIEYLKDNHLGRATFFPLSVIKERYVDFNTLNLIKNNSDFIGVLSDLVNYDSKYKNVVCNQLGMVLVSCDLDSANRLSKLISNKYKIVTLDGDVIHAGGSMSGGSSYQGKSIITMKQEYKHLIDNKKHVEEEMISLEEKIKDITNEQQQMEEKYFSISRDKVTFKEKYDLKNKDIDELKNNLDSITKEWERLKSISDGSISDKEAELIKKYHDLSSLKEATQNKIEQLDIDIEALKDKMEEMNALYKVKNFNLRNLEKDSRELEVMINRYDVKLDNMLNILSDDYELSYSKAKDEYKLDIEPDIARNKVNTYKANIKRLGMVNLASIEEYERINTRYVFLTNQREDLLKAEDALLEIMNEMDDVMKEEFALTFDKIQIEFKSVFKKLFGGGSASLKLTDPDNLLTTGVEIIASPPGKKLTTISLLSGGEKTLTAISLLFAMLNVRSVPFCLFDEVEAALDEANVEGFGKYLENYKDKTQFLIITHKKKTMEYASTLYGITMQESGVSKLVSVKLADKLEKAN